jgi:hypothetical protein
LSEINQNRAFLGTGLANTAKTVKKCVFARASDKFTVFC